MDEDMRLPARFSPGTKHWTEAKAREVLKAVDRSGLSRRAFARSQRISENRLKYWAQRLKWPESREGAEGGGCPGEVAGFVEVSVVEPAQARRPARAEEGSDLELILAGQRRVRVPVGFDAPTLQRLLGVLEGDTPC